MFGKESPMNPSATSSILEDSMLPDADKLYTEADLYFQHDWASAH